MRSALQPLRHQSDGQEPCRDDGEGPPEPGGVRRHANQSRAKEKAEISERGHGRDARLGRIRGKRRPRAEGDRYHRCEAQADHHETRQSDERVWGHGDDPVADGGQHRTGHRKCLASEACRQGVAGKSGSGHRAREDRDAGGNQRAVGRDDARKIDRGPVECGPLGQKAAERD